MDHDQCSNLRDSSGERSQKPADNDPEGMDASAVAASEHSIFVPKATDVTKQLG